MSAPAIDRPPALVALRAGPVSARINPRVLLLTGAVLLLVMALGAWAMTLGSFALSIREVWASVSGDGTARSDFIVWTLRLPRVLVAVLVGALLAISGAIFQGLVRNALVSPDIIGINAGASLAAVFWIVTAQASGLLLVAAFAGAVVASMLVYGLSWRGGIASNRMILIGIGVSALMGAVTTFLVVRFPLERVGDAVLWTTGSVYASDWGDVRLLATTLAVLLPLGIVLMWGMRILQMGDQTAQSLGQRVEPTRLALLVLGCAAAAIAVSIAGPVGFVAFMIPHVARMLAGPMTGGVLALTAALGGTYLLACDMLAQHGLPAGLPVGTVTSALGAPYFLFLLWRTQVRL